MAGWFQRIASCAQALPAPTCQDTVLLAAYTTSAATALPWLWHRCPPAMISCEHQHGGPAIRLRMQQAYLSCEGAWCTSCGFGSLHHSSSAPCWNFMLEMQVLCNHTRPALVYWLAGKAAGLHRALSRITEKCVQQRPFQISCACILCCQPMKS